jgi:hypothetical protein
MDIEQYLYDSISITPEALSEEFARVALDLAYWNARYADALKAYREAEVQQKRTKAMLYIKHRTLLTETNGKTTEAQVDAAVLLDPSMVEADTNLIATEVEKEKARGVLDAVRAKREMVVSLGAHIRAEMAGDPSLRSNLANTRLARENANQR